jgi:Tol biopolymer transport system component
VETTWDARVFGLSARATSQIVSIDLATGKRTEQTSGPGLKLMPQLLPDGRIGFLTKSGEHEGVGYTRGAATFPGSVRSPAWSPNGKQVIYEKVDYSPRPQNQLLYSWDPHYEYRYTDVFPSFSKDGILLVTNKNIDSSVVHPAASPVLLHGTLTGKFAPILGNFRGLRRERPRAKTLWRWTQSAANCYPC